MYTYRMGDLRYNIDYQCTGDAILQHTGYPLALGAEAATADLSVSLSTTKILFKTAKTARHALVHCSSPLESLSLLLSFGSFSVDPPKPIIDIPDSVGICIADIPGNLME